MAQALRHEAILDAYWTKDPFTTVRKLDMPITFNSGGRPNRSPTKLTSGGIASVNSSYVFCDDEEEADYWTCRDMIEYLLAWHSPRKPNGTIGIPFICDNPTIIPVTEVREIPTEGARVMDVIEEILDRRVALSASIKYDAANNRNILHLHSTSDIVIQGVPANVEPISLVCWSDPATSISTSQVATNRIHQIIARGDARITIRDALTEKGWETADETKYVAGASGDAGYGPSTWEKMEQNEKAREEEPVRNVFRRLKISKDITFLDDTTPTRQNYTPYRGRLGIKGELPLDPTDDYDPVTPKTRRLSKERKPNLAYVELTYMPSGRTAAYQHLQQAVLCEVIYDPDGLFIDVNVLGAPQHRLSTTGSLLQIDAVFDNAIDLTDVKFTLPFTDGRRATGVFPASPTDRDQTRRMVLDFPGNELIEIIEDTVIGLNIPALGVKESPGGFVIDSRPELVKLAERAAAWFTVPRTIVSVKSHRLTSLLNIGQIITDIDSGTAMAETPKSVIGRIEYDLPRVFDANAPAATMTITTFLPHVTFEAFS